MSSKMLTILINFSIISMTYCDPNVNSEHNANNGTTFYYFAYGSNLLAKRIHIKNPTAVFYSTGKLANYRLDFNIYAPFWDGAVATIAEDEEADVWGDLWEININQMKNLDEQENPDWYFPKTVIVTTPEGIEVPARTYQEKTNPRKLGPGELLPLERRPSNTYLEVIALGAIESGIPAEYVGFLFSFPTNGKRAPKEMTDPLGYPF